MIITLPHFSLSQKMTALILSNMGNYSNCFKDGDSSEELFRPTNRIEMELPTKTTKQKKLSHGIKSFL